MTDTTIDLDLSMQAWARLFEAFNTSPERYPVASWRYEALDIWPILKTQFMLRACNLFHAGKSQFLISAEDIGREENRFSTGASPADVRRARAARPAASPKNAVPAGLGRVAKSFRPLACDVVFWSADIARIDIGEFGFAPLIDPFRAVLEEAQIRTAALVVDIDRNDPVLKQALAGGAYGFREEFGKLRTTYADDELINFDAFDGFAEWFAEMDAVWPVARLHSRAQMTAVIKQTQSCYQILLDYYRAQALKGVALFAFYGLIGHASAAACRDIGIPCIDIQHGVAGRGHESYHWPNSPAGGYNTLPTHFLTWGEAERESITEHSDTDGPQALMVGHAWRLAEQMLGLDPAPIAFNKSRFNSVKKSYGESAKRIKNHLSTGSDAKRNIIVSLFSDQPVDWLRAVIEASPQEWRFHIRLHPGEAKREGAIAAREAAFAGLNAEVAAATSATIPEIMPHMNAHLTKYSSTVLDALAYGVPSICFSQSASWFYPQDKYPSVTTVEDDADAIVAALSAHFENPTAEPTPGALSLRDLQQVLFDILGEQPDYGRL